MFMRIQKDEYVAPEVEFWEVNVEQGFLNSIEDPDINDEIEW